MSTVTPAFFDNRYLPNPEPVYVCWLDVMGTQNSMLRSVKTAANFVAKLHDAVLTQAKQNDTKSIRLFPMMDGVYIKSPRQGPLRYFLSGVLRQLAETFLQEKTPWFRFLVRGCIAFGPLVDGKDITDEMASRSLFANPDYRNTILLGIALAQAFRGERQAPPFGISIDESARAFAGCDEEPFSFIWWDWYSKSDPPLDQQKMYDALVEHFDWCITHSITIGYEIERIKHHKNLVEEYWNRTRRGQSIETPAL
ncbi:MAG: hypothetical protein ABIE70_07870 [bacterium]